MLHDVNHKVRNTHEMGTIANILNLESTMGMGLADRLKAIIDSQTDKRGKFNQLESLTSITAENWKSFFYGRQRPNPDMIEAIAQQWPEYAFWLATGIADPEFGHCAPEDEGFPKGTVPMENSTSLLRKRIELRNAAVEAAEIFWQAEDLGELPLTDRWVRMAINLLDQPGAKETSFTTVNGQEIDLRRLNAARQAYWKAEQLRRAELIVHNDLTDSDYELTEALLDKADRLLKYATPEQIAKLDILMNKEREAIERSKAFTDRFAEVHKSTEEFMQRMKAKEKQEAELRRAVATKKK